MSERKILGQSLPYDERILLAQLTNHPGWVVLVKVMAEACRNATEEAIKVDPASERYLEVLSAKQTTARAMSKFSNEVLQSVREHLNATVQAANAAPAAERTTRFSGFKPPQPPSEGE